VARGKKRHQNPRNSLDESYPTQTGQEEEIASPSPSPHTSPRRGIPEEKKERIKEIYPKKLHKDS
jgi:hypothetical protein